MYDLPPGLDTGLPVWAVVTPLRLAHIERVVALLGEWATELDLAPREQRRWAAAGWLHDAYRNAEESVLREWTGADDPVNLMHGPAAAARLAQEGIRDDELLEAIKWHTVGYAEWGDLGLALYAADFLEPGRPFLPEIRTELAREFCRDRDAVIRQVIHLKLDHLRAKGTRLYPLTEAFATRWG